MVDSIASVSQLRNVALGADLDPALYAHMTSAAGRQARQAERSKLPAMKLSKSNRYLSASENPRDALWISAKTSSAIEGIRRPYAEGLRADRPATVQAFIEYWKKKAAASGR